MTILSARDLVVMRNGCRLLDGVSADFAPGSLTGLIGPNGAGKTTFLKALLGLVPIDGGDLRLDGKALTGFHPAEIARRVGYLAQGAPCHWPMSVERIIALGLLANGQDRRANIAAGDEAVAAALAATGTAPLRRRAVTTLSGGERTLVMIARCLAGGAPMLLADEPVTGLDPRHQLDVMEILRDRVSETAGTVAVLHDLTLAARYCDRLILMTDGRIVAQGSPAAVLRPENLAAVYRIEGGLHFIGGQPIVLSESPKET
ncbi:ABC transporter ATP-binding protein [bacterium SCSIO 12827]|nr:ABC transporter ATP-binding protein [bacterium SCSIO 12827]